MRLGRDRENLDADTPPPFTVGEIVTRLNALARLDDSARAELAKGCGTKKNPHVPTGEAEVGGENHCWKCGEALK